MTDRLYYHDSFVYAFQAEVCGITEGRRPGLVLDRTAFYPSSGGQPFDTGWLAVSRGNDPACKVRVTEVAESADGTIVHYVDDAGAALLAGDFARGTRVHGEVDVERRRDHMQQHSAQHILSAAFENLYGLRTVSFHMGDEYCSIDLDTPTLGSDQVVAAERLTNDIVVEGRPVAIRFATRAEALTLGLRKDPVADRDELRIIDIQDFDRSACGGTHVRHTGQVGSVLLRKVEKVRHGWRVEFVAGHRAVVTARHDFDALAQAAALFSARPADLPQQARQALDEVKSLRKQCERLQDDVATAEAASLLADAAEHGGRKVVVRTFADRDMNAIKLLAQKLTRRSPNAVALLATTSPPPSLVFAQSAGGPLDMRSLMKDTLAVLGGRGGGAKDLAQGGVPTAEGIDSALAAVAREIATP